VEKNNEILAATLLSVRDNHATLPYFYARKEIVNHAAALLAGYILKQKVNSLLVFNEDLIQAFNYAGMPSYYTRAVIRHTGFSNTLKTAFPPGSHFQDGEGDVAFT
jgi:hypothetical protein